MLQCLIMCRSLTYAQKTARIFERRGITAAVTRAPQETSSKGCAYCVKVSERNLNQALTALKNAGLGYSKVFLQTASGEIAEVNNL